MSTDKILTATYLPKAVRKKLERLAKKERTTISRLVLLAVEEWLKRREKERGNGSHRRDQGC